MVEIAYLQGAELIQRARFFGFMYIILKGNIMLRTLRNTAILFCATTATSASAEPAGPSALDLGAIIDVGAVNSEASETSPAAPERAKIDVTQSQPDEKKSQATGKGFTPLAGAALAKD
ncbi:hypothetical protein [Thioclava indica]|uniref:hypothetical protein n=1 Tax=Thioclava indica TaxID=1353528 RepID=UPI00056DF4FD|nr:hypothetical protein [Thioclava indica]